jgi:hypothetical protein
MAFAVGFTNDLSVAVSTPAGRADGAALKAHNGLATSGVTWTALRLLIAEPNPASDDVLISFEFAATRRH